MYWDNIAMWATSSNIICSVHAIFSIGIDCNRVRAAIAQQWADIKQIRAFGHHYSIPNMQYIIFEFQFLSSISSIPNPWLWKPSFEFISSGFKFPIRNYIQVFRFPLRNHIYSDFYYPVSNSSFVNIYRLGWHDLRITHKLLAIVACRKLKRSFGIAENDLSSSNVVSVL